MPPNSAQRDDSIRSCTQCGRPLDARMASNLCESCASEAGSTCVLERPVEAPAEKKENRYERLELLGRGGMGEVYRARQRELERIVALKVILAERCSDDLFVARFRREALAMARLNHPGIVTIYDYGELDGRPFLAMEFVAGSSLRARLRQGSLAPEIALDMAIQICEAVAYAHDLGIVHRDLKPENVLVAADGRIKIADFGLAKLIHHEDQSGLTREGVVVGTLRYMAPEQLAGTAEVDARADVYSLGVMLYELFTGKVPMGHVRPPSQVAAVAPVLDAPLLRALEAEPAQRFASARPLAEALASVRAARGAIAPVETAEWQAEVAAGNLPAPTTSLVGRESERQQLPTQLTTHRLVTLTGPGGTGKTRLAMQVGQDLLGKFPQGVWFVPLAEISDPRRVPAAIANIFGLREEARDLLDTVCDYLSQRTALLILDNFEQIVSAATIVARLLDAAPRLRVLVTSRIPLRLTAEHEFPVSPLSVPSAREAALTVSFVEASPAVTLFIARARAVRPDFQVTPQNMAAITEICRRLDGLPLAIELAAARIRVMNPESLAARLSARLQLLTGGARDLPARQQTMRGAIAWSYDLLTPSQRTLLAWLTVFRGSFSIESVERFVSELLAHGAPPLPALGEPLAEYDVLDALTALVDHNLLQQVKSEPAPRFALYETVREFGEEQMGGAAHLATLRHAHADWCLATVRHGEPALGGSDPLPTLAAYDDELPDFRAALAWWRGAGNRPDDALQLLGNLWFYWVLRGVVSEGIEEAEATVNHSGVTRDTPDFSRALHALGTMCYLRDRPVEARVALEQALDIRRRHETAHEIHATLGNLASLKRATGDLVGALADLQEVLDYQRRTGNTKSLGIVSSNLSLVLMTLGRLDEARSAIHEAITCYSSIQDSRGLARQQLSLGRLEHSSGNYEAALRAFEASRAICRELSDRGGILNAQLAIANSLTSLGRYDEALQLFAEFEATYVADESPSRTASFRIARGYCEWKRGKLDRALQDYRECLRLRLSHNDRCGISEVLVQIAEVFAAQSRWADAARLLGAEGKLSRDIRLEHDTVTRRELERTRQRILDAFGDNRYQELFLEGQEWPLERVAVIAFRDGCDLSPGL